MTFPAETRTRCSSARLFALCAVCAMLSLALGCATSEGGPAGPGDDLPVVVVTRDDTEIDRSCRVVIPAGVVIEDEAGDGVIRITSPGVRVEFAEGSVLRGAPEGTPGDALRGTGIRVDGCRDVFLRHLRVEGFKVGVHATRANGLIVAESSFRDMYRMRLGSTPMREDPRDWLWPHENDAHQWRDRYGGAIVAEDSVGVSLMEVRVREGQNGIVLDGCVRATVARNDCSFLSGWGLAMWRTIDSTITGNQFDFCIRGHSEGVYNRGQDSAGILMFEQCSRNIVAHNSCTHGGDGVFGFAGREALGETGLRGDALAEASRGCADNTFVGNDLSYAAAHGLEMTFSTGNVVSGNRVVENAICGIWGGYSRDMVVAQNDFARNGRYGYGQENGAINIEHGAGNFIFRNRFVNNSAGVHLWWDADGLDARLPGVGLRYAGVQDNEIVQNEFVMDDGAAFPADRGMVGIRFRSATGGRFGANFVHDNRFLATASRAVETMYDAGTEPDGAPSGTSHMGDWELGREDWSHSYVLRARNHLRGRQNIVMGEWGPWDHESAMMRVLSTTGREHAYELFLPYVDAEEIERSVRAALPEWSRFEVDMRPHAPAAPEPGAFAPVTAAVVEGGAVQVELLPPTDGVQPPRWTIVVRGEAPGVHPYAVRLGAGGFERTVRGVIFSAEWDVAFWTHRVDPLDGGSLDAWRGESRGERVVRVRRNALSFPYGHDGPSRVAGLAGEVDADLLGAAGLGRDRFSMIARTRAALPEGEWTIRTTSDDGLRVVVDGAVLIERWDIHGPTRDEAVFRLDAAREVEIVVEHFENDGYAWLEVELEPTGSRPH